MLGCLEAGDGDLLIGIRGLGAWVDYVGGGGLGRGCGRKGGG